jgi:hypothetical protein
LNDTDDRIAELRAWLRSPEGEQQLRDTLADIDRIVAELRADRAIEQRTADRSLDS